MSLRPDTTFPTTIKSLDHMRRDLEQKNTVRLPRNPRNSGHILRRIKFTAWYDRKFFDDLYRVVE